MTLAATYDRDLAGLGSSVLLLSGDYTLSASDDGRQFACTVALNINAMDNYGAGTL